MLRLSKITDYGIVLLARLRGAMDPAGATHNARELSAETGLPFPVVGKVLKTLAREGLLDSHRGARGGYALAQPPEEISVAKIIAALEGPVALTECGVWRRAAASTSRLRRALALGEDQPRDRPDARSRDPGRPGEPLRPDPLRGSRDPIGTRPMAESHSPESLAEREYEYGFTTDVEQETLPPGLDESTVRFISAKKDEPEWLLEWRLKALRRFLELAEQETEPTWAMVDYPKIDYQAISYWAAPKQQVGVESLDEVDPELLRDLREARDPAAEQKRLSGVAVDAVFDSVSVATTFKAELEKQGIIFCSFSEAVQRTPSWSASTWARWSPTRRQLLRLPQLGGLQRRLLRLHPEGRALPHGALHLLPHQRRPTPGQFERTLLIADEGAYVSYLEGCTAPMRDENQLHAAVVELVALDDAEIKYSTVQNWYPGDKNGVGGIYNFVTKRGACRGKRSKISWTQVETGSAITWKYPSCILQGDDSVGEFYSVALTANHQQADTGTKMIHIGKNTQQHHRLQGHLRGVRAEHLPRPGARQPKAEGARNYSQCDSLLLGDRCGAHTFPYLEVKNPSATVEHEATTSKIGEDQLFYCRQRGISEEDAVSMIVNGFCKEVLRELPMEFAVEAQKLLGVSLEGSVG